MSATIYYYDKLNREQQKAYHAMLSGLTALAPSFPVPRLSGKELADIFFLLRLDHPEIFYAVTFTYRFFDDSEHVELIPEYLFKKNKIRDHQQAMQARIRKLIRPAEQMNEREKEQYIHDFICRNVTYDKLKKAYSHEIIGALGHGVAVCEGIAKAVKILCDGLGLWCIIALSEANPEKGIKYRHAWNVIRIDGQYYHLDVTFDNSLGNRDQIRYDYFNLNDTQIFRDHEPVIWPIPVCQDGTHTFYREKKISFTKMEEVQKRTAQAVKKGRNFLFQWRGSYLTREVLLELLTIFHDEAARKGKYAAVSVNWPQAVLLVEFREDAPEEQLIMQEANEGELSDTEQSDRIGTPRYD